MGRPFPYNVRVGNRYGAPMGRHPVGAADDAEHVQLNCRRVPLPEGYDGGGAYWGIRQRGEMLFCIWSPDRSFIRYVDARSYLIAQERVREEVPGADFLRG